MRNYNLVSRMRDVIVVLVLASTMFLVGCVEEESAKSSGGNDNMDNGSKQTEERFFIDEQYRTSDANPSVELKSIWSEGLVVCAGKCLSVKNVLKAIDANSRVAVNLDQYVNMQKGGAMLLYMMPKSVFLKYQDRLQDSIPFQVAHLAIVKHGDALQTIELSLMPSDDSDGNHCYSVRNVSLFAYELFLDGFTNYLTVLRAFEKVKICTTTSEYGILRGRLLYLKNGEIARRDLSKVEDAISVAGRKSNYPEFSFPRSPIDESFVTGTKPIGITLSVTNNWHQEVAEIYVGSDPKISINMNSNITSSETFIFETTGDSEDVSFALKFTAREILIYKMIPKTSRGQIYTLSINKVCQLDTADCIEAIITLVGEEPEPDLSEFLITF